MEGQGRLVVRELGAGVGEGGDGAGAAVEEGGIDPLVVDVEIRERGDGVLGREGTLEVTP